MSEHRTWRGVLLARLDRSSQKVYVPKCNSQVSALCCRHSVRMPSSARQACIAAVQCSASSENTYRTTTDGVQLLSLSGFSACAADSEATNPVLLRKPRSPAQGPAVQAELRLRAIGTNGIRARLGWRWTELLLTRRRTVRALRVDSGRDRQCVTQWRVSLSSGSQQARVSIDGRLTLNRTARLLAGLARG